MPKRLVLPAPDPEMPVARFHFVVASPVLHLRVLRLSCPVAEAVCAMTAASAICLPTGLLDVAFAGFQLSIRFWLRGCAAVWRWRQLRKLDRRNWFGRFQRTW